nr:hypothetical protein Iba_scaffold4978CG0210 [Ipomoea batatas]
METDRIYRPHPLATNTQPPLPPNPPAFSPRNKRKYTVTTNQLDGLSRPHPPATNIQPPPPHPAGVQAHKQNGKYIEIHSYLDPTLRFEQNGGDPLSAVDRTS